MEPAQDIPLWNNLVPETEEDHVFSFVLSDHEVAAIEKYGVTFFDKQAIDKRPSQHSYSKGANWNPNTRGIKGEYAGLKFFEPETDLQKFLTGRPYKTSDRGDIILVGNEALVFDYKLRTMPVRMSHVLSPDYGDMYMAGMDIKFADSKYDYIDGFIFCLNNEATKTVSVMGWILRKEFLKHAQIVKRGESIPHAYTNPDVDQLYIPYRRLKSMVRLLSIKAFPITADVNEMMKRDWKAHQEHALKWDVQKYVNHLQGLPSTNSWLSRRQRASQPLPRIPRIQAVQ